MILYVWGAGGAARAGTWVFVLVCAARTESMVDAARRNDLDFITFDIILYDVMFDLHLRFRHIGRGGCGMSRLSTYLVC